MLLGDVDSLELVHGGIQIRSVSCRLCSDHSPGSRVQHITDRDPARVHNKLPIQYLSNVIKMRINKPIKSVLNRLQNLRHSPRGQGIAFRLEYDDNKRKPIMISTKRL